MFTFTFYRYKIKDKADIFYVIYIFQTRHESAAPSYVTIDYLPYILSILQGNI